MVENGVTVTVYSRQGVKSKQYSVSLVVLFKGASITVLTDTLYMRLLTSADLNEGSSHWMQGVDGWKSKLTDVIPLIPTNQNRTKSVFCPSGNQPISIHHQLIILILNWLGRHIEFTSSSKLINSNFVCNEHEVPLAFYHKAFSCDGCSQSFMIKP